MKGFENFIVDSASARALLSPESRRSETSEIPQANNRVGFAFFFASCSTNVISSYPLIRSSCSATTS
jgi:hypothetical protein